MSTSSHKYDSAKPFKTLKTNNKISSEADRNPADAETGVTCSCFWSWSKGEQQHFAPAIVYKEITATLCMWV